MELINRPISDAEVAEWRRAAAANISIALEDAEEALFDDKPARVWAVVRDDHKRCWSEHFLVWLPVEAES